MWDGMPKPMKSNLLAGVTHGITLRQPWAWLVAAGWKPLENRSQCFKYRGAVAIHAAKVAGYLYDPVDLLRAELTERFGSMNDIRSQAAMHSYDLSTSSENLGAILGIATIVGCLHESDSRWYFGPHGLVMNNPELFDEPIPWRGMLGIWKLNR